MAGRSRREPGKTRSQWGGEGALSSGESKPSKSQGDYSLISHLTRVLVFGSNELRDGYVVAKSGILHCILSLFLSLYLSCLIQFEGSPFVMYVHFVQKYHENYADCTYLYRVLFKRAPWILIDRPLPIPRYILYLLVSRIGISCFIMLFRSTDSDILYVYSMGNFVCLFCCLSTTVLHYLHWFLICLFI